MLDDRWLALIQWCQQNPYCTIEKLEIVGGNPNLIVVKKQLSNTAIANIKIKYNSGEKSFTKT